MNFILKNKFKIIFLIILLVLGIFSYIFISKLFFFPEYEILYGNRLNGIENYDVNDSRLMKVASDFAIKHELSEVKTNLSGKIINFIVPVPDTVTLDEAKEMSKELVSSFSSEELSFFEIQIFLKGSTDEYPKIGYKHETTNNLVWSN